MNILNNLPKTTQSKSRRVGRGYGSGVGGHTTGKGAKGQKIRSKPAPTFDGTKIKKSWVKRLPFLRGKHRLLAAPAALPINLDQLNKWFKTGAIVSQASLNKKLNAAVPVTYKIVSQGEIGHELTIKNIAVTQKAKKKLLAAGAKIEA